MIEILKTDFEHCDDRGTLCQLVHKGYCQVNVVFSKAGTFRGGHYHKENNEAFYVVNGSFEIVCTKGTDREARVFRQGDFFQIPPYVVHSFNYLEDTLLIGLYDIGVEHLDGTKDIYPEG